MRHPLLIPCYLHRRGKYSPYAPELEDLDTSAPVRPRRF